MEDQKSVVSTPSSSPPESAPSSPPPEHSEDGLRPSGDDRKYEPLKIPSSLSVYENWALGELTANEKDEVQALYEKNLIDQLQKNQETNSLHLFQLEDVLPTLTEGVGSLLDVRVFLYVIPFAQDSFTKCFSSHKFVSWNWNIYLFPMWLLGLVVRYGILFPLRLLCLITGTSLVLGLFFVVSVFSLTRAVREKYQRLLVRLFATIFVASWSGVVRYHGTVPKRGPNQIFVANHTSLIDVVVLEQSQPYAIVGQKHVGFVGFLQDYVLACMGCLWFDRNEQKDRLLVSRKIKEHVRDEKKNPLLIFPEGTCVNNEYCVMFKKGAFELGATVYPIAIKYNKIFSNPHWNSKKESFPWHLFRLMTSWAVVADVYYLKPQTQQPDESPTAFANHVKDLICKKAGLTPVPWDGYLKHVRPSARFVELRQKAFAASLSRRSSSTNLAGLAELDGREERLRHANTHAFGKEDMPRRRSHVNFEEIGSAPSRESSKGEPLPAPKPQKAE